MHSYKVFETGFTMYQAGPGGYEPSFLSILELGLETYTTIADSCFFLFMLFVLL